MGELTAKGSGHPLVHMFNELGIREVSPEDEFHLSYKKQFLQVRVKRESGDTVVATRHVTGKGFRQITQFNPGDLSKAERNMQIHAMYDSGYTQAELSNIFGLSQAMISRVLAKS